jgi:hypothetical protein
VSCHHVTKLYLQFQEEWVTNLDSWNIDEWNNLSMVSFDFELDDDILEQLQEQSNVAEINVLGHHQIQRGNCLSKNLTRVLIM